MELSFLLNKINKISIPNDIISFILKFSNDYFVSIVITYYGSVYIITKSKIYFITNLFENENKYKIKIKYQNSILKIEDHYALKEYVLNDSIAEGISNQVNILLNNKYFKITNLEYSPILNLNIENM
jgi:hypothetical protein